MQNKFHTFELKVGDELVMYLVPPEWVERFSDTAKVEVEDDDTALRVVEVKALTDFPQVIGYRVVASCWQVAPGTGSAEVSRHYVPTLYAIDKRHVCQVASYEEAFEAIAKAFGFPVPAAVAYEAMNKTYVRMVVGGPDPEGDKFLPHWDLDFTPILGERNAGTESR